MHLPLPMVASQGPLVKLDCSELSEKLHFMGLNGDLNRKLGAIYKMNRVSPISLGLDGAKYC